MRTLHGLLYAAITVNVVLCCSVMHYFTGGRCRMRVNEARRFCKEGGGHLPTFRTEQEMKALAYVMGMCTE